MATVKVGKVASSYLMSNKNPKSRSPQLATVEHFVAAADVTAYNAAADDAARAATDLGVFLAAEQALTSGVLKKVEVGFAYVQDAAVPPTISQKVFAFDKIGIQFQADGEYYSSSIPGRNNAAITMSADGITIDLTDGAAMQDYVAAFNTTILSEESVQGTVTNAYIRS